MNCIQIRLTNTLLYLTPDGPLYINNTQLAYYKLIDSTSITPEDLQAVLDSSSAPNGIWYVYQNKQGAFHVVHQAINGNTSIAHDGVTRFGAFTDRDLVGVFPSMSDVIDRFPEHFI